MSANKRRRVEYVKNPLIYFLKNQIGNKQISKISNEYNFKFLTEYDTVQYISNEIEAETIIEIVSTSKFLFALNISGQCLCFDRISGKFIKKINNIEDIIVRSIYYNKLRDEILILAFVKDAEIANLGAYAIKLSEMQTTGIINFRQVLDTGITFPGFIEFQTCKHCPYIAVTCDFNNKNYKIWDLDTYEVIRTVNCANLDDIKLCNGFLITQYRTIEPKTIIQITDNNTYQIIGDQTIPEYIYPNNVCELTINSKMSLIASKNEFDAKYFTYELWNYIIENHDILIDNEPWDKNSVVVVKKNITVLLETPVIFNIIPFHKLEFVEQLNECLFVKYRATDWLIINLKTSKQHLLKNSSTSTPESFTFLYSTDTFVYIEPKKNFQVYNTKGIKLYEFENHMITDINITSFDSDQNIVFTVCEHGLNEQQIHVSCVKTGKLLKTYDENILQCKPSDINCLYFSKSKNEIVYGDIYGLIRRVGFAH
jgi:hypothetical protein